MADDDFDILLTDAVEVEELDYSKCAVVGVRFTSSAEAEAAEKAYFNGELDCSPSFPMRFYKEDGTLEPLHHSDVKCLVQDFGIQEWEYLELFKHRSST